jgi:hypothetical protein
MQRNVGSDDPWLHAIKMLKRSNNASFQRSGSAPVQPPALALPRQNDHRQKNTFVKVLEKPTNTTATVAWFDSTACHYGDQSWLLRVARSNGICALTGEPVRKGDRVYQPRKSGHRPCNANEMILSSVLSLEESPDVRETRVVVKSIKRKCEHA